MVSSEYHVVRSLFPGRCIHRGNVQGFAVGFVFRHSSSVYLYVPAPQAITPLLHVSVQL